MMHRIVVLNPKGGSGKTTIATNLAACYAVHGMPAALVDYDSQGSSTRWLSQRPAHCAAVHGVDRFQSHPGMTRAYAMRMPPNVQRVVVDTPAALNTQEMVELIRRADKIIFPILPSDIDIHAAMRCVTDLLHAARISRDDDRLAIVANRVKRNTMVFRSLMKVLHTLDIPIAATFADSQNYIRAAATGLGIHELPVQKTRTDVAQWRSLVSWLERDVHSAGPADVFRPPLASGSA